MRNRREREKGPSNNAAKRRNNGISPKYREAKGREGSSSSLSFSFLRSRKTNSRFFPSCFLPSHDWCAAAAAAKSSCLPTFLPCMAINFALYVGKRKKGEHYLQVSSPTSLHIALFKRRGGAAPSIYPENCHLPNKSERPSARRSVPSCMFCYQSRYVTKNAISPSPRFPPSPLDLFLAFVSRFCGKKVDK